MEPDANIRTSFEIDVDVSSFASGLPGYIEMASEGEYVYLVRDGKRIAALVAADTAEYWANAEDDYWAQRTARADTSVSIPQEEAISMLE